jgi:hypothetical protein
MEDYIDRASPTDDKSKYYLLPFATSWLDLRVSNCDVSVHERAYPTDDGRHAPSDVFLPDNLAQQI